MKKILICLLLTLILYGCNNDTKDELVSIEERLIQLEAENQKLKSEIQNNSETKDTDTKQSITKKTDIELENKESKTEEKIICDQGFTYSVDKTYCLKVPDNAYPTPNSKTDAWMCDDGFYEYQNSCLKKTITVSTQKNIDLSIDPEVEELKEELKQELDNIKSVRGEIEAERQKEAADKLAEKLDHQVTVSLHECEVDDVMTARYIEAMPNFNIQKCRFGFVFGKPDKGYAINRDNIVADYYVNKFLHDQKLPTRFEGITWEEWVSEDSFFDIWFQIPDRVLLRQNNSVWARYSNSQFFVPIYYNGEKIDTILIR